MPVSLARWPAIPALLSLLLAPAAPLRAGWEAGETAFLAAGFDAPVTLTLLLVAVAPGGRVGLERVAGNGTRSVEELLPATGAAETGRPATTTVDLPPNQGARLRLQGSQEGTLLEVLFERADGGEPLGWLFLHGNARDTASRWQLTPRFLAPGCAVQVPAMDTLVLGPRRAPSGQAGGGQRAASSVPPALDLAFVKQRLTAWSQSHAAMLDTHSQRLEAVLRLMTLEREGRARKPRPEALAEAVAAMAALDALKARLEQEYGTALGELEQLRATAGPQLEHCTGDLERLRGDGRQGEAKDLEALSDRKASLEKVQDQVQAFLRMTESARNPFHLTVDLRAFCERLLGDYLKVHGATAALGEGVTRAPGRQEHKASALRKDGPEDRKRPEPRRPPATRPPLAPRDDNAEAARLRREAEDRDAEASAKEEARRRQERREWQAELRAARVTAASAPAAAETAPEAAAAPESGQPFTLQWHDRAQRDLERLGPAEVDAIHACLDLVAVCGLEMANHASYLGSIKGHSSLQELRPRGAAARIRPLLYRDGQSLRILRVAPHGAEYPKKFEAACRDADRLRQAWPAPDPENQPPAE